MSVILVNSCGPSCPTNNFNKIHGFFDNRVTSEPEPEHESETEPKIEHNLSSVARIDTSEPSDSFLPTFAVELVRSEVSTLPANSTITPAGTTIPEYYREIDEITQTCTETNLTESIETSEHDIGFASLINRHLLFKKSLTNSRDPLHFFADLCFTPIRVNPYVYQILSSSPGLNKPCFQWDYSLVHHGKFTYSWSLLKLGPTFERTSPVMRPIGMLETSGRHFNLWESVVTDLQNPLEATCMKITHYPDSWRLGGLHIGFQFDNDYRYEWQPQELVAGSGEFELMLWRINVHDNSESSAARLVPQFRIQNPIDHHEPLWSLEIDLDHVKPHIALLTALNLKIGHPSWHAWFAPKEVMISPPRPLLNFAFQDEGRVYQQSGKFWGDWEEERIQGSSSHKETTKISLIRVFNKAYLKKFALSRKVLNILNEEADRRIAIMKSKCSIYPYVT